MENNCLNNNPVPLPAPKVEQSSIIWKVGDRASWSHAPSWWNPHGEQIIKISENKVWINYWASPIEISQLLLPQ